MIQILSVGITAFMLLMMGYLLVRRRSKPLSPEERQRVHGIRIFAHWLRVILHWLRKIR